MRSRAGEEEDAEEQARARCLRLLALRARSAAELRQRLIAAGFGRQVIAAVLSSLQQAGLVDDEEFARGWVGARGSTRGKAKLRWELRQKGVSPAIIRRVVDEGIDEGSEIEAAREVVRRRVAAKGAAGLAPQELARLQRLLRGRGFGYGVVEQVLRRFAAEEED
jgi:regulatory protein